MATTVIGNIISFVAAVILVLAVLAHTRRTTYIFQTLECITLAAAQVVFGMPTACAVLMIGAVRNVLIVLNKYTKALMALMVTLSVLIGLMLWDKRAVGLIPIIANVNYTVSSYYAKSYITVKLALLVNLIIWIIYSALILDISTTLINTVCAVVCIVEMMRHKRRGTKENDTQQA